MAESAIHEYEPLVSQLTDELSRDLPANYAFFGHSMGALLAYGCASSLIERGSLGPKALFVACCAAPSQRDDTRFSRLQSDDELIRELKALNGTPSDVFEHAELLQMTLDTLRADFGVCASFRPRSRNFLQSDIHVFGGRDDGIDESRLAAWRTETSAVTTVETFEGGHFFLRESEDLFLARLQTRLNKFVSVGGIDRPSSESVEFG